MPADLSIGTLTSARRRLCRPHALAALRHKMAAYQANGARLGWLLIPHQQAVEVWPASGEARTSPACSCSLLKSGRVEGGSVESEPQGARPRAVGV